MYRIIQDNHVVAICDRFRWVRMMDGVLVGTIKATAQGFEARVPVAEGDTYTFEKQVYALEPGGLTGTEPVASIVEFHGAVDLQDKDTTITTLAGEVVDKQEAQTIRGFIETAAEGLDDATASQMALLFQSLKGDGNLIQSGARINWNGSVKRAAVDLWDTEPNNPDNAPTLWEELCETHDGSRYDPIPYEGSMALVSGKYYSQDGVTYLCNRDTVNPVYNPLRELVGIYVEEVR